MDWLHNGIFRLSSEHFSGCLGIILIQYFINSWTLELEISLICKFPLWMKPVCLCRALTECCIGCTFVLTGVYQFVCLKRLMNFTCLSHCLLLSNLYAIGAIALTVGLSVEVSWRRRYVGCFGKEWSGISWIIDYRTGSSRWVWGTAKSLEF